MSGLPGEAQNQGASADEVVMLLIEIDGFRCGLPLDAVREVLPAARVEPLPGAPVPAMGVLNLRGEPLVVVDGAACIGGAERDLRGTDRFVVLAAVEPRCALRVEAVHDLMTVPADSLVGGRSLGATGTDADVALLEDGLLVIRDGASFVAAEDAAEIRGALEAWIERSPA
jgi:chemotaxis signal transduction protein